MKITFYIEKYFNKAYWPLCALIFLLIALRAFFIPFSHDETATFFFYVQPTDYLPYKAHIYTNNHVLNSALANICYKIAGSHRFILRLPNVLSFLLMCIGIRKHFKYVQNVYAKVAVLALFLFIINFLDFFELCRGYGLSFGLMTLGMAYLLDYFNDKKLKHFFLFSLLWQLALSANLILVTVFTVLFMYVLLFQLANKVFLKVWNIIIQLFNIAGIIFWVKFSFFYKEHGALDYGVGDNYWKVTFKTLMLFLSGTDALWLQALILLLFLALVIFLIKDFFSKNVSFQKLFELPLVYPILLSGLVLTFYLQKIMLGVNLPEDRTGLFFYLFFVFSIMFLINHFSEKVSLVLIAPLVISSLFVFIANYNVHDFSSYYYHTMPKSMYHLLEEESKKANDVITIGGHRVRELNYAFTNYRGNSVLNHMDDAEQMTMNCDYYYTMKREQPYYKYFYDEIAYDKTWDQVLLKRKEKIQRKVIAVSPDEHKSYNGTDEFYSFINLNDSAFKTRNCIEAEITITFDSVPKPFRSSLVLQINDEKNEIVYYKKVPLNWLADNLNGQIKHLKLTAGPLPAKVGSVGVYLWNIKKQPVHFTLNELKIYELSGTGVNVVVPESFYQYLDRINDKLPHL